MQLITILALALAFFRLCLSEPIPHAQPNRADETQGIETRELRQLEPGSRLLQAAENPDGNKLPCGICYAVCQPFFRKCANKCYPDKWSGKACKVSDRRLPSNTWVTGTFLQWLMMNMWIDGWGTVGLCRARCGMP